MNIRNDFFSFEYLTTSESINLYLEFWSIFSRISCRCFLCCLWSDIFVPSCFNYWIKVLNKPSIRSAPSCRKIGCQICNFFYWIRHNIRKETRLSKKAFTGFSIFYSYFTFTTQSQTFHLALYFMNQCRCENPRILWSVKMGRLWKLQFEYDT